MRLLKLLLVVLAFAAGPAVAGPFEDGSVAYNKGDYATALRLWRPLADQGEAQAQYELGFMYTNGWGVPQDYAAAVAGWRKAADQGYATAQSTLGVMYYTGLRAGAQVVKRCGFALQRTCKRDPRNHRCQDDARHRCQDDARPACRGAEAGTRVEAYAAAHFPNATDRFCTTATAQRDCHTYWPDLDKPAGAVGCHDGAQSGLHR